MTLPPSLALARTVIVGLGAVLLMPARGTVAAPAARGAESAGMAVSVGDVAGAPVVPAIAASNEAALACMAAAAAVKAVVRGTNCASEAGRLLMSAMAARTADVEVETAV